MIWIKILLHFCAMVFCAIGGSMLGIGVEKGEGIFVTGVFVIAIILTFTAEWVRL